MRAFDKIKVYRTLAPASMKVMEQQIARVVFRLPDLRNDIIGFAVNEQTGGF